jgi:C-terminal processing protease CtpA/Prc
MKSADPQFHLTEFPAENGTAAPVGEPESPRVRENPDFVIGPTPREFFVEPGGPLQFTKPVVLLTHRHSVSAAENFTLAMRRLPHVTVVGETTSGAFADVAPHTLPNGWRFTMPFNLFVDHRGFCWEGIGLAPHLRQTNRKADLQGGRDRVLDLAIALIDSGGMKNRAETPEPSEAGPNPP